MTALDGVALVTGASRGLGAAIAEALAATGQPVAVNYASTGALADAVVSRITDAGGRAAAYRADVTSAAEVERLVAEIDAELGPVTVLVVNATGAQPTTPIEALTTDDLEPMLDFFVRSPTLLTTAVVPGMRAAGAGRIVHIGSDVVDRAPEGNAAYVAAKSAQLGLARVAARELGRHGITVNTVQPGWVPVERHADVPAADLDAYLRDVPVGRAGTPAEVAASVVHLASREAAFVNGAVLAVNGGSTVA
ncbi:SDR family NAD(P)-dependent oxidoreductase [Solicola sp. PLA-1-18]|uniref:SDR family NAD(P)-dependent oxidoreductase n=1 Tax=Solicola sp. PLA-1-18 TaxID=3380532 RepID=UPI003B7A2D84